MLVPLVSIAPPHSVTPTQPPIGELMPCELPPLVLKPPLREPAPPFYFPPFYFGWRLRPSVLSASPPSHTMMEFRRRGDEP
mmetsp:Transcript_3147/g.7089  ORF Transcript_3147/g.7089 Transcript_3147/m.7089 type:complete len:81 (-) Transcript_3147:134-376(-)